MVRDLIEIINYPFIFRALIVGLLISICASVIGVTLVLKRYANIGNGLSHVAFGLMSIGIAIEINPLVFSLPFLILVTYLLISIDNRTDLNGDIIIGLLSVSSLAIGVLVINYSSGMNTDVCNYMFGTILGMTKFDLKLSVWLSTIVLVVYYLYYDEIFAITFDESLARIAGLNTNIYNILIGLLTSITIVLGMRMMGAMLISSSIIFPAVISMKIFNTFKKVIFSSIIVSIVTFTMGLIVSYLFSFPTGASVVLMNVILYVIVFCINIKENIL